MPKILGTDRVALFMEGEVGGLHAKMGYGILRYAEYPIVCAIDSTKVGRDLTEFESAVPSCQIVASVEEAAQRGANVLILAVAPFGGYLPEDWVYPIQRAIDLGMNIVNGMHTKLSATFPVKHEGQWIWDIRTEPQGLGPGTGRAMGLSNQRVLAVGTDMAVGKMTVALKMHQAAKDRGLRSSFIATGQTGICIAGRGIPLDAIRVDYSAGAVEAEVMDHADAEILWIEGQGALCHPAASSNLPLMRGSMPTDLILCHKAGMIQLEQMPDVEVPNLRSLIQLYEDLATCCGLFPEAKVSFVALNTAHLSDEAAVEAMNETAEEAGVPCYDVVRGGATTALEGLV
ncbi:MAG: DUF1611 domain-containing protein [Fimbriimonadaceae bacterium]